MQLKNTYLMTMFLVTLLISSSVSCSQTQNISLKWSQISADEVLIDVILPSGIEIKDIRYRKENLGKKWLLQIKNTSGTTIKFGKDYLSSISRQDFSDLFADLVLSIRNKNGGQLDRIQIGLGLISELWEDTSFFLKEGAVSPSYKLRPKDLDLAKKISSSLESNLILQTLCNEVAQIKKGCISNYISMNPVMFELDYIGKEWRHVEMLPNMGMPINKLWFGVSLSYSDQRHD